MREREIEREIGNKNKKEKIERKREKQIPILVKLEIIFFLGNQGAIKREERMSVREREREIGDKNKKEKIERKREKQIPSRVGAIKRERE